MGKHRNEGEREKWQKEDTVGSMTTDYREKCITLFHSVFTVYLLQ